MRAFILAVAIVSSASAAEPDWTLAWQDDFSRSEVGPDWKPGGRESDVRLVDGRLEISGNGKAWVMSTRGFPPDVRFEFDGGVLPGRPPCDLSPGFCCNEWRGWASGYHLAFGANWGKRNALTRPGAPAIKDNHPDYPLDPGTRYHIVAMKDGSRITLTANDHLVLAYDDPDPLGGPGFDRLALTTWSGIYVDNVKVYVRKGQTINDVPWMVELPPLPLTVLHGKIAAPAGLNADVAMAIDAFNADDPQRAWTLFSALPDSLLKAAGLAACLGDLDYPMAAGQADGVAELFTKLAEAAPPHEQAGLRACAVAARLRDDPGRRPAAPKKGKKPSARKEDRPEDVRCMQVNGLRLLQLGPRNNPYYWRATYDIARLLYWDAAEGRDETKRNISRRLFEEILSELPDHRICREYAGQQIPWGPQFSQYPDGTPVWAAALHEAYGRNAAILEYWITHRQAPDGTMGGGMGDDVELFRSWQPLAAISTATPIVREGVTRLCDGVWHNPSCVNGFWNAIMDVEHGTEYTADTQPVMVFIDYGEPEFYERNLESTRHIHNVLTGVNQRGMRQFKSVDIGGKGIGDVPQHQADVPYHARAMKTVMWLAWAGNPTARTLFLEWCDLWLDAAMSQEGGKPAGVVPPAVWYPSGSIIRPSGHWWEADLGWSYFEWPFSTFMVLDAFNCAHYFTHDDKYLVPMQRTLDRVWSRPPRDATELTTGSAEWAVAKLQAYRLVGESLPGYRWVSGDLSYDENIQALAGSDVKRLATKAYTRYLVDHDLDAFSEAIQKQTETRRYNFELQTQEVLATDRAGIPVDDFFGAYTGAARRWSDMGVPSVAVTWVADDTNFAALVQTATDRRLKLRIYQFSDKPVRLGMRLWQLRPGRYERVAGPEETADDGVRRVESSLHTFDVRYRGQIEYVEVPPRQSFAVDVRLIQPAAPPGPLPDLAIGRGDVTVSPLPDDTLEVKVRVHNIGAADAGAARVSLRTGADKTIAEAALPPIPAPNDLTPKVVEVRLVAPKSAVASGRRVDVQLDGGAEDANPLNNTRLLPPAPAATDRAATQGK